MRRALVSFALMGCGSSPSATGLPDAGADAVVDAPMEDLGVWPNSQSQATSDPWIVLHHDTLREMHPRVLALNFVNGRTNADMEALYANIFAGLREGSRYHGYSGSSAPFLYYEIAKSVDLTDHPPPVGYTLKNSTKYPRKPGTSPDTWHLDYHALFSPTFADFYGIADPKDPSRNLTLCELIDSGLVHEVWIYGDGDTPDVSAAEVLEYKQKYDAQGNAIPGAFDACAGNGCFDLDDYPSCGRSIRIPWVNDTRGPGCLIHSLGHGFEGMARGAIPYLKTNFSHFGNFDFKTRLQQNFGSWYNLCTTADCVSYTGPNALDWKSGSLSGTIDPFDQGCGNVHFPPNARGNYDDANTTPVLSTCEHFGMHDGPDGGDLAVTYTNAKSMQYDSLEPDCEGGWQVYWRQSFPGLGNKATDSNGNPMKNWWPYEFY